MWLLCVKSRPRDGRGAAQKAAGLLRCGGGAVALWESSNNVRNRSAAIL
jgi:hypothetical protein